MAEPRITLPDDKDIANNLITAQSKERGMLGHIFGTREHAPTNIAGLIIMVSIAAILFLLWLQSAHPTAKIDGAIPGFFALMTSALGYLFGRGSSS